MYTNPRAKSPASLLMLLILECSNNNNSCCKSYEKNKNENSQKLFVLAKFVDVNNSRMFICCKCYEENKNEKN